MDSSYQYGLTETTAKIGLYNERHVVIPGCIMSLFNRFVGLRELI